MTAYKQGDVLLVPFPFTNQQATKRRPAVVISGKKHNQAHPDVILAPIISQIRSTYDTAIIAEWQMAGLIKPSVIKPILSSFDTRLVIKQLGQLTSHDRQALRNLFKQIMDF